MELVIIGTGNVAEILGMLCKKAGHTVLQVYGRTSEKAFSLAAKLEGEAVSTFSDIRPNAQLYLVALADAASTELHLHWHTKKGLVVHTAGSVPIEVLKDVSPNYGVLYPLQSLRAPHVPQAPIPLLVDANTADNLALLTDFAYSISTIVQTCSNQDRQHLHLAAVLVNNFTNHLYQLAWDYCDANGLDFQLLQPLILETAQRVAHHAPATVQTGPAIRNDEVTMNRHMDELKQHPQLAALYEMMSASIAAHKKG
jgi:predicted short-subunit dehydrogenase-like oxidoreductase (DUF2520 family)